MTRAHVCVVLKRTSFSKWVEEDNDRRVAALLEAEDEAVARLRPSHREHLATIEEVRTALAELDAKASWHDRASDFRADDGCALVLTVGGDGTLLAASHGIGPGVPLLGVNSAPSHSVGFFCAARKGSVREALAAALEGTLRRTELSRMRVEVAGKLAHDRVLNEALFCHASPAATSRYVLRLVAEDGATLAHEEQKSSGLWVGPAAGSTAAIRSAGGRPMSLASRKLQYVVREPYLPPAESPHMTAGMIEPDESLEVKSKMRHGRLFLDGDSIMHEVAIGEAVTVRRSAQPLVVLGLTRDAQAGRAIKGASKRR